MQTLGISYPKVAQRGIKPVDKQGDFNQKVKERISGGVLVNHYFRSSKLLGMFGHSPDWWCHVPASSSKNQVGG